MKHEYKIISGARGDVEHAVSNLLNEGWMLQGGLSVFPRVEQEGYGKITRGHYSQAMVKYADTELLTKWGADA